MSRTTTRRRRPATPTYTTIPDSPGPGTGVEPLDEGWQRTLDLSRALFGASLGTSQEWMRGLGDWQQAQATALRRAGECIDEVAGQAEGVADWPSLWALQANLAGAQWTRALQDCSELIDQAMQIEARFVERGRSDAVRLSQHWRVDVDDAGTAAAKGAVEASAPLALFDQAQQTMGEMSRLWTQALYRTTMPD